MSKGNLFNSYIPLKVNDFLNIPYKLYRYKIFFRNMTPCIINNNMAVVRECQLSHDNHVTGSVTSSAPLPSTFVHHLACLPKELGSSNTAFTAE